MATEYLGRRVLWDCTQDKHDNLLFFGLEPSKAKATVRHYGRCYLQ